MIPLPPAQVHLWCSRTDIGDREFADRDALLSDRERIRAARFHDVKHTVAFTAAHGWLRRILGAYLRIQPQKLRFIQGPYGKPTLATDADRPIAFNLSHSGDLAIVAVTAGMPIGVDIERVEPKPGPFAGDFLAPGEAAALAAVAPRDRDEAFTRCWTRKEAYLKALGTGLNTPLSDFEVSVGASARLLRVGADPGEAAYWRLGDLKPAPGYCGAVAARQHGWACVWMARPGSRPLVHREEVSAQSSAVRP
jgi:4'-phosphopantetheinyl transferase